MNRRPYFVGFLLFLATALSAQPDYARYDSLLQKHVSTTGGVNYASLKKDIAALRAVTAQFSATPPQKSWPRNEQLTFWINAYNAFTLLLVTENYPIESITALDKGKPWDVKRIRIGSSTYSLNQIENDIIRPQFRDPRIHFALNCAARSCPPLFHRAYRAVSLDEQLELNTRTFVRSGSNQLGKNRVKVSKIFEWYSADFGPLPAFLNRYSTVKIAPNAVVEYAEYDWGLNKRG